MQRTHTRSASAPFYAGSDQTPFSGRRVLAFCGVDRMRESLRLGVLLYVPMYNTVNVKSSMYILVVDARVQPQNVKPGSTLSGPDED